MRHRVFSSPPVLPGQQMQGPGVGVGPNFGMNPMFQQQQPLGVGAVQMGYNPYLQQAMVQPTYGNIAAGWAGVAQQQPILGNVGIGQVQPMLGNIGLGQMQQPIYPGIQQQPMLGSFGQMQQPMLGSFGGINGIQAQQPMLGFATGTVAPVLPQDFGSPAAAFGQLAQPVLSPQQLQQVVSTQGRTGGKGQRIWELQVRVHLACEGNARLTLSVCVLWSAALCARSRPSSSRPP
jgi:hypothetical protein